MTMRQAPRLDSRSEERVFQDVADGLEGRLKADGLREDPLAAGLLRVFARFSRHIIDRLNRAPDKNRLAFLDILNVSRTPPVSARAPLTFTPVKRLPAAQAAIIVPSGTRVAAAPGEGESEPAVFETMRDLYLTNSRLVKVVAHDPGSDSWGDKSWLGDPEAGSEGEFAFATGQPVDHELYIGSGSVFGRAGISRLAIRFEMDEAGRGGLEERRVEWWIPTPRERVLLVPVRDETAGLARSGEVVFESLPEWPAATVFGCEMPWLACRLLPHGPSPRGLVDGGMSHAPRIRKISISASWTQSDAVLEGVCLNHQPVDASRDFFALGERPRFGDSLYVSSAAFSNEQARITLRIRLTNPATGGKDLPLPPLNPHGRARVQWEYWDGRRWSLLECEDGARAFTEHGEVAFQGPPSWQRTTVNGLEGFWIRGRLVSGGYGEEERVEYSEGGQITGRVPSTLSPPCIQSVSVSSSLWVGAEIPERVVTRDNLSFGEGAAGDAFRLFPRARDSRKALYLGFEVPAGDLRRWAEGTADLQLYFHVHGATTRPVVRTPVEEGAPVLTWEYWSGSRWVETLVADGTASLTVSGLVDIRLGSDLALWRECAMGDGLHEQDPVLHWVRVVWKAGEYPCLPRLRRVLLNTVPALQTLTLLDEILGAGSGLPGQVLHAARSPVLHGLRLEVREPVMPSQSELARIRREEGPDAVREIRRASGEVDEVWVRWHAVSDFLNSGHGDRHYVVHHQTGEVRFGDGVKGMIPPRGVNNIRLARYRTGGGALGNKPRLAVSQLRSAVPYVDSVVNLEPASGGLDLESWSSVRERGASCLRHRERAVTLEDYEDLARLAVPSLAKVRCYPNRDLARDPSGEIPRAGVVSLVVVPHGSEPMPMPDLEMLDRLREALARRSPPGIALVLLAPEYVRVSVQALVEPARDGGGSGVVGRCLETVERYCHPLRGGPDGRGWDFGQVPSPSDFYACLESVPGVDHVVALRLRMEEGREGLLRSGSFLITPGDLRIGPGSPGWSQGHAGS